MKQKSTLIITMLLVITAGFALPATFSLGTGQHQFTQIDPQNPDAFCEKCHGHGDSINTELMASGNGLYNGGIRIHSMLKCVDCHAITERMQTTFVAYSKTEHAAKIPSCLQCHSKQGMGTFMGDVKQELNSPKEAHKNFDDDTACIGCHTTVTITGSFSATYSQYQVRSGLKIGD